jgi:parallel beta-helix repeat protein
MVTISRICLLAILFFTASGLSQNTYYVSPAGNNNNSGLSVSEAFATLQHAADIVSAGDSVLVLEGTYSGFDLRTNGTQGAPIVFKALVENVLINQPNSVTNDGINIESADWVVVDGFIVNDQARAGIRIVTSDFVIIRNNICADNYRWGIFTGFTDDILIENNTCSGSEDEHGIYVSNSGDNPVVRNNICFVNNASGIQLNADASQGGDGIITNAVIEGNIIYSNGIGGGAAINLDGVQESLIFNNLLYDNHATGIALFMIDGAEGSKNNKIYNNTIVNPANTRWNILLVNGSTGNILYNNILINNHSFRGSISIDQSSVQDFTSDYNILENRLSNDDGNSNMSLAQWQALGYDLHSIIADPEGEIFINHTAGDFHLLPGSQPINIGSSLVSSIVFEDLDNISRPQGSGFDIGAYEFSGTTGVEENILTENFILFQNYPNPFNPTTKIKYTIAADVILSGAKNLNVSLRVYDVLGNEVAALVNEEKLPGAYEINFDGSNLSCGIYFYTLTAGGYKSTKKLILIK